MSTNTAIKPTTKPLTIEDEGRVIGVSYSTEGTKLVQVQTQNNGVISSRLVPGLRKGKVVTVLAKLMPAKGQYQARYFWDILDDSDEAFAMPAPSKHADDATDLPM